MSGDGGVAPVGPLAPDPVDESLDRLGPDRQVPQCGEVAGGLLRGGAVHPGVHDLLLHAGTEARVIKAERLALREKKPADSGGNSRPVVSRRRLLAWS
jgi:hypothetical protein